MATNCLAPTNLSVSQAFSKPEGSVVLYWSNAKSGIDNSIIGYLIRAKDNVGVWYDYGTVYTELTSYSTTVSVSSSRGSVRYFSIVTLGSAGLNSTQSTDVSQVTVNSVPGTPLVAANRLEVPANGNKDVSFTITAGSDIDPGQEVFFFYAVSTAPATKILITAMPLLLTVATDTTFLFWNFDGYEYNTSPTQVTIIVNKIPVVSMTGEGVTPLYYTTGPSSLKMFKNLSTVNFTASSALAHSLSYSYKIRHAATISSGNLVSPVEIAFDYPSNKSISVQGRYFQIRVTATDDVWSTDSGFSDSAVFYSPKAPSSTNTTPVVRACNPQKVGAQRTMTTDYYRRLVVVSYTGGSFSGRTSGFGNIVSASLDVNSLPNMPLSISTGIGAYSAEYDLGVGSPSTVQIKINLTDEFGQILSINRNTLTKITSSTARVLEIALPSPSTKIHAYDSRNTNPIKTMDLSFPNYAAVGGDTAFVSWDYNTASNYKDFSITLNNIKYSIHDYISHSELLPSGANRTLSSGNVKLIYNQSVIGTTTTLQNFNNDSLSGSLSITVFDSYGVENTITVNLVSSISFTCAPSRDTELSSALSIELSGSQPGGLPAGTKMVYPSQEVTLTYLSKIFSDPNATNGASEFNATILRVYMSDGVTLDYERNMNVNCEINTSFSFLMPVVSSVGTRVVKICAEDSTSLRSLEFLVGTFVIMPITGPASAKLISASFNGTTSIVGSFTCVYSGFSYYGVYGHSATKIKLKISNPAVTVTPNPKDVYSGGNTNITTPTEINPLTLTSPIDDTDVTLVVEITYRNGQVIEYLFNTLRLRKTIPTTSVRKNRMSINKAEEDVVVSGITDSILYVNVPVTSGYKIIYLVNEATDRKIKIDISSGEVDGLVIESGSYS